MASLVNITMSVDESGALTGIRNIDAGLKKTTATVAGLDSEVKGLAASWGLMGNEGAAAGRKAAAGADQAAAGMDRLKNKSALARFELQELGLRAPRYFASAIAGSQVLMGIMSSLSGVFIGIAAISMFGMAIREAKEFYNAHLNVNGALEAYNAEQAKHKDDEFGNVHSIETTIARLRQATQEAEKYNTEANKQLQGDAVDFENISSAKEARDNEQKKRAAADALRLKLAEEQHKQRVSGIEADHAGDSSLRPQQKITAELEKQKAIIKENQDWARRQDSLYGNTPSKDAGKAEADTATRAAQAEASAKKTILARTESEEITRLQAEADNAGVRGDRLAYQQKEQAAKEYVLHHGTNAAALAAIDRRYYANLKREEEEAGRATQKRMDEARTGGLTGLAHSDAAFQLKQNQEIRDAIASGKTSEIHQLPQRLGALSTEHANEDAATQGTYYEHLNQLVDGWNTHQEQGFARIQVETRNHVAELTKEYDKLYGGLKANDPRRAQGTDGLNSAIGKVNADASKQGFDLTTKNLNETVKLEDEARRRSLPVEQQKTQELYDQYAERTRGYGQMLKDQLISQDDYDRRVAAAGKTLNAELRTQAKETQDKLAGQLEGLFKNPQSYFKNLGTHMMSESAAAALMQVQKQFPGQHTQGADSTSQGGFPGTLFSSLWSGKGKHGAGGGVPNIPNMPGAAAAAEHVAGISSLSISTATIQIGSASITGAGGSTTGGGSGYEGGGFSRSSSPHGSGAASTFDGAITGISSTRGGERDAEIGGSPAAFAGADSSPSSPMAAMGDLSGAAGLYSQAKSAFAHPTSVDDGSYSSSNNTKVDMSDPSASSGPGAAGAVQGAMGLYGAFAGKGGVTGALGGAASGMQLGMSLGGPYGAAVGAIAGGVMGFMGFGGRSTAETYYNKNVKPHIDQDTHAFSTGTLDYMSAYQDMSTLQGEALHTTSAMGFGGRSYYRDTIKPAISSAQANFTREETAGRSQFTASAAQYHTGGAVDNFGNLATSPDEGLVHAKIGEFMVKPNVAARNRSALESLNAGASMDQVAKSYQSTMQSASARSGSGGGRTVNMNFQSLDSKTTARMFMDNKHHVRAALNASLAEYSGVGDASN
jgi:hypothetical protein